MSCHECFYISGHAPACSQFAADTQFDLRTLQEHVRSLEERIEQLESDAESERERVYSAISQLSVEFRPTRKGEQEPDFNGFIDALAEIFRGATH